MGTSLPSPSFNFLLRLDQDLGQGGEKTLPGLCVPKYRKLLGETSGSSNTGWLQRCLSQANRLHCVQLSWMEAHSGRHFPCIHFAKMLFSNTPAQPIWHPRFLLPGIPRQMRSGILTPEYISYIRIAHPNYYVFYE